MRQLQALRDKLNINQAAIAAPNIKGPGLWLMRAQALAHILSILRQLGHVARGAQNIANRRFNFVSQFVATGQNPPTGQRHMLPIPGLV